MRRFTKQAQHETLAAQRHARIGEVSSDYKVGDRVMTVDGFPGRVADVEYGPYQYTEDYKVVLDGGMGGGTYSSGQLRPYAATTASVVEAAEVHASIPFEASTDHTANFDYPELEDILDRRLPNENIRVFAANNTAQDDTDDDESDKLDQQSNDPDDAGPSENGEQEAAAEPGDQEASEDTQSGNDLPNVTPPSACSFCGGTEFGDPQMTGRGTRMRCEQCGGTMKSWGGQWEPEFPNSPQNNASEKGDDRSGGVGGVAALPDSNFKTTKLQTEAGILDWVINKIYDHLEDRLNNALLSKNWAAPSHLEQFAGPEHTDRLMAGDHALPDPQHLTIHGALQDQELFWHFTATWMDVQAKARRIRAEGHVKIIEASKLSVVGEVKGDHNVYETQLNYVVGTKRVADWACGCKWASYAWGRSKPFKKFEGRLCSHALALQYEASARGMFGKDVHHDKTRPDWQKAHQPVVVQWDKAKDKNLTRRVVPPGNMKRTFSSLTLDSDGIYPQPGLLDLERAPIYAFAVNMLDHNEPITNVVNMLANFGTTREAALAVMHEAWAAPASDGPQIDSEALSGMAWGVTAAAQENEALFDQNAAGRDLSDHDAEPDSQHQTDGDHKKKHRTNDAREHADHWGWGYPQGVGQLVNCTQCEGSGCGHCAGLGQVPAAEEASSLQAPTSQTPDETPDAGPDITSDGVTSSLKTADYSSADPMVGVGQEQNYYSPTPHSHSTNPASTGWATGQDPGDWGNSLISNNFGVTFDASLHTAVEAGDFDGPTVSGVAVKAHDTGRVLMIQRSHKDEKDPARGTWEFPGGHHEDGDQSSLHAGIREWQEEIGQPFPQGGHVTHVHRSGPYLLHTVVIPSEDRIDFSKGRSEENPDDPDGDDHEQAAWWDPEHAKKNPALRNELKTSPSWGDIKKAAAMPKYHWVREHDRAGNPYARTGDNSQDAPFLTRADAEEYVNQLHEEHRRNWGDEHPDYEGHWRIHSPAPVIIEHEPRAKALPSRSPYELPGRTIDATLHPDPEGALPTTDGLVDDSTGFALAQPDQEGDVSSIPVGDTVDGPHVGGDDASSIRHAFLQTKAARLLKESMKDFTHQEQQELINEGIGDRARNFSDLKIAGTHYELLPDDQDDNLWFL